MFVVRMRIFILNVNIMIKRLLLSSALVFSAFVSLTAQQGFFLDSWQPKSIVSPGYTDITPVTDSANASLTINGADTLTRIPVYMFGDNANAYSSSMSENKTLMKYIADRKMGVLRGPSGSISDVYFWNRSKYQVPADVPATLVTDGSSADWEWYGKRPDSYDAGWAMDIDSFYSVLKQSGANGLLTVNYGYARYGTSANPVAQAAHMAADWVRYDKGRTKFWEIGNEVFGSWEAGYQINQSLNQDGQPAYITGALYGKHCKVFIDSMKAAAAQIGVEIYVGAVAVEASTTGPTNWNIDLMKQVGDSIDFYIIHSYYTPYNSNSNPATILSSPSNTQVYHTYLKSCSSSAGKPMKPVAMTEYNIFAVGSKQPVSQINGMHAVMVTGESIKTGFGAICRWDLANGYSNGDDHGMYSTGDEAGVTKFSPRPAFYYMYYMQKYLGDVLLKTTFKGSSDITAYSSAFGSGQLSTIVLNKGAKNRSVRINLDGKLVGDRYYTYTLIGGTDIVSSTMPFSRKVYVNGYGPSEVAGGPLSYATIQAESGLIGNEILIETPPYSVTYVLIDSGSRQLPAINTVYPVVTWNNPSDLVYGTALSATQLNATADLAGTFTYDPPSGTLLTAGTGIELKVTFTPTNTVYAPITKTVTITVSQATPVVTWSAPSPIDYGTLLDASQLNATANIDGTFTYDPPSGTLLAVGSGQVLKVTFSPADALDYSSVEKTVNITVNPVTGIQNSTENDVIIYPVPVSDKLILSGLSDFSNSRAITVQILSVDGTVVRNLSSDNPEDFSSIELGNLPSGIYLMHLSSEQKSLVRRFVKQ
jgi:hypothetical protein